jgi:hypothetical protein
MKRYIGKKIVVKEGTVRKMVAHEFRKYYVDCSMID